MEQYPLDEDDILAQFPDSELHKIKKNRICLSISQLKNLFQIFNKRYYDLFWAYAKRNWNKKRV